MANYEKRRLGEANFTTFATLRSDLEKVFNVSRILNSLFSNVPQTMTACYVIHCHTDSQNANSTKNISAEEVLQLKY